MTKAQELRSATDELLKIYDRILALHNNDARAAFRYVLNLGKDEEASELQKEQILDVTGDFYKERFEANHGKKVHFTVEEQTFGQTPGRQHDVFESPPAPRGFGSLQPQTPTPLRFQSGQFGNSHKRARQDEAEGSKASQKKMKSTQKSSAIQQVEDTMDEELAHLGTPRRSQNSAGPKVSLPRLENSPLRTARAANSPSKAPATGGRNRNLFATDNAGSDSGTGR